MMHFRHLCTRVSGLRLCARLGVANKLESSSSVGVITHQSYIRTLLSSTNNTPFTNKLHIPPGQIGSLLSNKSSLSFIYPSIACRNYSSDTNGHLVYRGRVHSMFRGLKIFSLTTSALGLLLQPYLWYTLQDMSLVATVPLFTVVNLFVFTNPFLIHFLSKRYVNELYFNPKTKEFTATVLTFFARKERLTFTAEDVRVPDIPGMFSMLTVKGRPLFVDERDFTSMEVYKHMMGFDRPLDLRRMSNNNNSNKEDKVD